MVSVITLFLVSLNACATPAKPKQMTAQPANLSRIDPASPMHHAIAVTKVGGGEETNPLLTSKVGNKELEDAVRESLRQYGFLSQPGDDARYRLEVHLIDLKQPGSSLTMIVHSSIRYKLIRIHDEQIVYNDIITASEKATLDDAYYGPARLNIANERSIRANLTIFMDRLHALKP